MQKILITIVLLTIIFFYGGLAVASALDDGLNNVAKGSGFLKGDESSLPDAQEQVRTKIGTILSGIIGLLGLLFLVLTIYGGVLWMTSGGDSGAIKKGKGYVMYSIIGLLVVGLSYTIANYILNLVIQRTTN